MTGSTRFVSVKTYALAFAVALSPAMMQTGGIGCEPDTALSVLEVEAPPGTQAVLFPDFTPQVRQYDVITECNGSVPMAACVESGLMFRAFAEDPGSTVHYKYTFLNCSECPDPITGFLTDGGGEVLLEDAFVTNVGELQLDVACPPPSTGACYMARYSVAIEPFDIGGGGDFGGGR